MFSSVELRGKALIVHSMQAGPRVLRENVQDLAVALQGSLLRVVAFTEQDQAWFFSGEDELHSERLDLGAPYGGGGRLICDEIGRASCREREWEREGAESAKRKRVT